MTAPPALHPATAAPDSPPWTCPFCSLHCDGLALQPQGDGHWQLDGTDCPRALAGLARVPSQPVTSTPLVRGQPATLEAALTTAATWLQGRRAPLVGGWVTDILGARAAYRLTARLGAVADHLHGEALTTALRAQQDRGGYTTTLAEVRSRADVILCVGTQPSERFPEFFRRIEAARANDFGQPRQVVFLGAPADPALPADHTQTLALEGDLLDTLGQLEALVAGRPLRQPPAALQALATQLQAAHYAVIVWEVPALTPPHGALAIEALQRLIALLNRTGRAGGIGLGGHDGGYGAQQVHAWLSGLPLRTRLGPQGLDHDPLRHGTARLLADGNVDALVWIGSLSPDHGVPDTEVPRLVLGHPALLVPAGDTVFIPVATPGIGAAGQIARGDGIVVLPLHRVIDQGLPSVAAVIEALLKALGDGA